MHRLRATMLAALAASSIGCGGYFGDASTRATQAAVNVVDSPKYRTELDDMAASAAGAARDKLLDADTSSKADALVGVFGLRARSELLATTDALLPRLHLEALSLRDDLLGPKTLEAADTLREHLFGQPLRDDLDAFAAEAQAKAPGIAHAAAAGATLTVNAEATKAEHVAMWIGGALLALLLLVQVLTHRKLVGAVAAHRTP